MENRNEWGEWVREIRGDDDDEKKQGMNLPQ